MRPFIAGIVLVVATFAFAQTPKNQTDAKGRQGVWKLWLKRSFDESDDSTIAPYYRICTYADGLAKGPFKDYYRGGTLFREGTLKVHSGISFIEGIVKQYRETGGIDIIEEYLKGKRHGTYKKYNVGGKLVAEGEMDDGKRVGEWKTFYDNGKLKSKGLYAEGDMDGLWISYNEDGTIKESTLYDHGRNIQWPELLDRVESEVTKGNLDAAERSLKSARDAIIPSFGANAPPAARLQFVTSRFEWAKGDQRRSMLHLDSALQICSGLASSGKSTLHSGLDKFTSYACSNGDSVLVSKLMPHVRSVNRDPDLNVMYYRKAFTRYEIYYGMLMRDPTLVQDALNNAKTQFPRSIALFDAEAAESLYSFWMSEALNLYRIKFNKEAEQCVANANEDSILTKVKDLDSLRRTHVFVDLHHIGKDSSLSQPERTRRIVALLDTLEHGDQQRYCKALSEAAFLSWDKDYTKQIVERLTPDCLDRVSDREKGMLLFIQINNAIDHSECDRARSILRAEDSTIRETWPNEDLILLQQRLTYCMLLSGQDSLPGIPPLFTQHADTVPATLEATLNTLDPDRAPAHLAALSRSATSEDMLRALIIGDTTDAMIDVKPFIAKYDSIRTLVRPLVTKHKTPVKKAEALFKVLHDSVLKKYVAEIPMRDLFTSGHFNCVSAVALYGLLCHDLEIPITYYDAPSHLTCGIPANGQVLLVELTSPKKGFNFVQERDSVIQFLLEFKLVTEEEIDDLGPDSVYRNYHKHRRVASFQSVLNAVVGNMVYRQFDISRDYPKEIVAPLLTHLVLDTVGNENLLIYGLMMLSEPDIQDQFIKAMPALAAYYHGNGRFFTESVLGYLPSSLRTAREGRTADLESVFQAIYDHAPIATDKKVESVVFQQVALFRAYQAYYRDHLDTAFVYLRTYMTDSLKGVLQLYYDVADELCTELVNDGRYELALRIAREEVDHNRVTRSRSLMDYTILRVLNSDWALRDIAPSRYGTLLRESLTDLLLLEIPTSYQNNWLDGLFSQAIVHARHELADSLCVIARRSGFATDVLPTKETTMKIMKENMKVPVDLDDVAVKVTVRLGEGEGPATNIISGNDVRMYLRFDCNGLMIGQVMNLSAVIRDDRGESTATPLYRFGAFDAVMKYWFDLPLAKFASRDGSVVITPSINGAEIDPIKLTLQR